MKGLHIQYLFMRIGADSFCYDIHIPVALFFSQI